MKTPTIEKPIPFQFLPNKNLLFLGSFKMSNFLETTIEMVVKYPTFQNTILYAPKESLEPNIYIFVPDCADKYMCPGCDSPLQKQNALTGQRKDYPGRILYDLERNSLLLTVILSCKTCGHFLQFEETHKGSFQTIEIDENLDAIIRIIRT